MSWESMPALLFLSLIMPSADTRLSADGSVSVACCWCGKPMPHKAEAGEPGSSEPGAARKRPAGKRYFTKNGIPIHGGYGDLDVHDRDRIDMQVRTNVTSRRNKTTSAYISALIIDALGRSSAQSAHLAVCCRTSPRRNVNTLYRSAPGDANAPPPGPSFVSQFPKKMSAVLSASLSWLPRRRTMLKRKSSSS